MAGTLAVNLAKPIKSARILDSYSGNAESQVADSMNPATNTKQTELTEGLEAQRRL